MKLCLCDILESVFNQNCGTTVVIAVILFTRFTKSGTTLIYKSVETYSRTLLYVFQENMPCCLYEIVPRSQDVLIHYITYDLLGCSPCAGRAESTQLLLVGDGGLYFCIAPPVLCL